MSEGEGVPTEAEKSEWLRWLVEDSLMLSSEEKGALLGKLNQLKERDQLQLLEILLDERRALDRLRRKAFESEERR